MELAPHVEEKLLPGHRLNTVIEAGLVDEFIKTSRVLALIEHNDTISNNSLHALLIFQTARVPVHSSIDLQIEFVIPVDINLKCEIDTSSKELGTDVLVNIISGKIRLLFEMPFGERTNAFVSDVLKAAEGLSKRRGRAPEFSWLQSYIQNTKDMDIKKSPSLNFDCVPEDDSVNNDEDVHGNEEENTSAIKPPAAKYVVDSSTFFVDKSPDMGVNRQSIAMGVSPAPVEARESHIKHLMSQRESSYTNIEKFKVFIGTWNVKGEYPNIRIGEWLACDAEPPDIYSVAFQELDLSTENFLFNTTTREQDWLNAVLKDVHPKARYRKVRLARLVGMMIIVLVQEKHIAYIRNVSVCTVGTGIMNKMGNKGAVSIRLEFHNTSICFTNAHMAAHIEEFERRNEDHDCIFQRTLFTDMYISGAHKNIWDHDGCLNKLAEEYAFAGLLGTKPSLFCGVLSHIYFFGDMNYRINPGDYDVKKLASEGTFKILLENEQLNVQRARKRIFHDFKEGEITFKPTFKYDLYSDNWDSSEKARQPAWCDRILWHGEGIEQKVYRSHPVIQISDHKPVSALFEAGIKIIDTKRYQKVYEEMMKKLDRLENEFLPQVTVDNTEIILDTVKFLESQTKYLTIANTGQVPVDFRFICKLNEKSYCKSWLTVRPHMSTIMPGDKCDVSFEVEVDKHTAYKLNSGKEKLYDILVLHLMGGKDIFITVTGDYERSCFGSSINALVHMNKPFRNISMTHLIDLESSNPQNLCEMPYAVPKELWYLVDHLYLNGLKMEGLFTTTGLHKQRSEIREALDLGVPEDSVPGSVFSVAEVLLLFLEALPEPVIPYNLYQKALDATPNFALCKEVVALLPDHHRTVFSYLMAFLKELLSHTQENKLDAKTLAHVFGNVLIKDPESELPSGDKIPTAAVERKKQTFIHHFLVNDYDL